MFTRQVKSAHELVATCARRAMLKYIIRSLHAFVKIISFKDYILHVLFCCQK